MSTGIFSEYFYYSTTRKVIAAVGAMFSEMKIGRYTVDRTQELERITVPLIFGQKEKYFYRKNEDPNLTKSIQKVLPVMSLEFVGLKYDSSRKQQTTQYVKAFSTTEGNLKQPMGVPYDISMKLSILIRHMEDGMQLIEQILPMFTPDYTLRININEQMGITKDFPVTLGNVGFQTNTEGSADDMRLIIWELDLTVKAFFLGLITDPAIIRDVVTTVFTDTKIANPSTVFILNTGGTGDYMDQETVYQGPSPQAATASGKVKLWDKPNRKLYITNITGQFANTANANTVIGTNTNASWNLNSEFQSSLPAVVIDVTPNPMTANAFDQYTFTTNITEYLNG